MKINEGDVKGVSVLDRALREGRWEEVTESRERYRRTVSGLRGQCRTVWGLFSAVAFHRRTRFGFSKDPPGCWAGEGLEVRGRSGSLEGCKEAAFMEVERMVAQGDDSPPHSPIPVLSVQIVI